MSPWIISLEDHWINRGSVCLAGFLQPTFLVLFCFCFAGKPASQSEVLQDRSSCPWADSPLPRGGPEEEARLTCLMSSRVLLLDILPFFHSDLYHSPSGMHVSARAMLLPLLELPFISDTSAQNHDPGTVLQVIRKLAFVQVSLGAAEDPAPMHLPIPEISLIHVAVCKQEDPLPHLPLLVLAPEYIAIRECEGSLAVHFTICILSNIFGTAGKRKNPVAVDLSIFPRALVL
eukprot:CAMPEP_0117648074 /NCGR_PEP_ID=MMETSP0804-20121206/195_1 /TAXON_ID=1074897 /ORGANISM="Tetraselmis astigmatica, Strain CCMP880" /LENGTH=231 /DNA_ID=CAMNT_0005453621 /DNA_START=1030 /DNA_END=1724 /DNA_ORIENTATION=+